MTLVLNQKSEKKQETTHVKHETTGELTGLVTVNLLLMEEIPNNQLGCMKPYKDCEIYHVHWLAGFVPSTGWPWLSCEALALL